MAAKAQVRRVPRTRKLLQDALMALILEKGYGGGDGPGHHRPREIVVQYTISAFMGLLTWWADREPPETAAQMDAIFQQLTMPGVLAGLEAIGQFTSSSIPKLAVHE